MPKESLVVSAAATRGEQTACPGFGLVAAVCFKLLEMHLMLPEKNICHFYSLETHMSCSDVVALQSNCFATLPSWQSGWMKMDKKTKELLMELFSFEGLRTAHSLLGRFNFAR